MYIHIETGGQTILQGLQSSWWRLDFFALTLAELPWFRLNRFLKLRRILDWVLVDNSEFLFETILDSMFDAITLCNLEPSTLLSISLAR